MLLRSLFSRLLLVWRFGEAATVGRTKELASEVNDALFVKTTSAATAAEAGPNQFKIQNEFEGWVGRWRQQRSRPAAGPSERASERATRRSK